MAEHASTELPRTSGDRLRFELIFASAWLGAGLFLLPGAIFFVGQALLGTYVEGHSIGDFYRDFFGDLASGVGRTWGLAVGPLIVVTLIRLVFLRGSRPPEDEAEHPVPVPPEKAPRHVPEHTSRKAGTPVSGSRERPRAEPRVSGD